MYTLHCTYIGFNWDLYVPCTDEELSFSVIVDKPTSTQINNLFC